MATQPIPEALHFGGSAVPAVERVKRPVRRSLWRGFTGRCPNCGEGKMFRRFLKVAPNCPSCGEDLSHERAHDAPPYITMVIVGHIIVPIILFVATRWDIPTPVHLAVWLPLTLIMTLALIQPVKGMVVGLQWALYMHGFDPNREPELGDDGYAFPEAAGQQAVRPLP